jgi:hypothetical protein
VKVYSGSTVVGTGNFNSADNFSFTGSFTVVAGRGAGTVLEPAKKFYPQEQSPIAYVDYRLSLMDDLYLVLGDFARDGSHATVSLMEISDYLSRLLAAFNRGAVHDQPIDHAFSDLGQRMCALAPAAWVRRFGGSLENLFGGYLWEAINHWRHRLRLATRLSSSPPRPLESSTPM